MLWFPDLTASDPYLLLPMISCCLNAINLEVAMTRTQYGTVSERMKIFLQMLSLGLAPIISGFPAASFVYTITSGVYTLLYTKVMRIEAVRSFLKLQPTKEQLDAFYLHPEISHTISADLQKEAKAVDDIMRGYIGMKVDEELLSKVQKQLDELRRKGDISTPILANLIDDDGRKKIMFNVHKKKVDKDRKKKKQRG